MRPYWCNPSFSSLSFSSPANSSHLYYLVMKMVENRRFKFMDMLLEHSRFSVFYNAFIGNLLLWPF